MRLLCIPGRKHENGYFSAVLSGLEQRGIEVVEPRIRSLWTFSYDILHINFPTHHITEERLLKASFLTIVFSLYLLAARCLGRTIVYTVHDVVPFKVRHWPLLKIGLHFTHRLSSGFIFLSRSSRDTFAEEYPGHAAKRWVVVPHGPYPAAILDQRTRQQLKVEIAGGQNAFVVGFLGAIKPYKNVSALRNLPERLPDGRPIHLVVAGQVEQGHGEEVDAVTAAFSPRQLTRIDRRLTDGELSRLIQTVDAVLLPYVKGSNSGLAMFILSNFGRLIGSSLPMFKEMEERVGAPWVYCCRTREPACNDYNGVILQAAQESPSESDQAALRHFLSEVDWPIVCLGAHDFYRELMRERGPRRPFTFSRERSREQGTGAT